MAGILKFFISAWLVCGASVLWAEPFFDPTRPPPAFLPPELQVRVAASAPAEPPLVLQAILQSPQRKAALISGRTVEVGQVIRGYRLQELDSSFARLLGPHGMITLTLLSSQGGQRHSLQGDSK